MKTKLADKHQCGNCKGVFGEVGTSFVFNHEPVCKDCFIKLIDETAERIEHYVIAEEALSRGITIDRN